MKIPEAQPTRQITKEQVPGLLKDALVDLSAQPHFNPKGPDNILLSLIQVRYKHSQDFDPEARNHVAQMIILHSELISPRPEGTAALLHSSIRSTMSRGYEEFQLLGDNTADWPDSWRASLEDLAAAIGNPDGEVN